MMIKPTVGRVVWYYPSFVPDEDQPEPLAAHIAKVHSDSMVNLMVISEDGVPMPRCHVPLRQDGEVAPGSAFCEWMPCQKGQAAKADAMDKAAAAPARLPSHFQIGDMVQVQCEGEPKSLPQPVEGVQFTEGKVHYLICGAVVDSCFVLADPK